MVRALDLSDLQNDLTSPVGGLDEGVAPQHQEEVLRLSRLLEHGLGFELIIAAITSRTYRQSLIGRLNASFPRAAVLEIPADSGPGELIDRLAELAPGHRPIHVVGFENWLGQAGHEALHLLNRRREYLAQAAATSLVFWSEQWVIDRLATEAPDLWAWRVAVLDFSQPTAQLRAANYETTLLGSTERSQLQRRLTEIREYLNGKPARSLSDAGLLLESSLIEKRLGDVDLALADAESARELFLVHDDQIGAAGAYSQIADILQLRGELDEALRIHREEILPVLIRLGDERRSAITKGKIADILSLRGQLDEALRI